MYHGIASRGIDLEPISQHRPHIALFFIAFIIVGSFFILNLFVGVVISTYNREKEKLGKFFLLTEEQKKWLEAKLMVIQSKPKVLLQEPSNHYRRSVFKMANHRFFEYFIMGCIIANTIVLATTWYDEPGEVEIITEILNYIFAAIFTIEAIIKLIGFGKSYFKDGWNIFDLIIVFGTLVGIVIGYFTTVAVGAQTTIIRSFRIGRMFRLFKRNKSLKIIFQTFIVTLPAIANVGSLLILFLYIYSIMGVFLFAEVKVSDPLGDHVNF